MVVLPMPSACATSSILYALRFNFVFLEYEYERARLRAHHCDCRCTCRIARIHSESSYLTRMCAICHAAGMENDYPLADTKAARMLADGLARAKHERGLSIRQIGKQMGYKTSVVLSHMASGRVPIPIDRSEEIADIIGLDKRAFLLAVLRQRHPDVSWQLLTGQSSSKKIEYIQYELESALGRPLSELTAEQRAVMREVAAEHAPARRWLSVHELHAVEVLRRLYPNMGTEGVPGSDLGTIAALLEEG